MNARVLELLKNPELTEDQDLSLLNSVVKEFPYIQSVRSVQLHGINKFRPDQYKDALSETAAYTTDKKILYQFINKKSEAVKEEETTLKEEEQKITEPTTQTIETAFTDVTLPPKSASKPVYVDGQLNRILFEGEEDFFERENFVIDTESTQESGTIVIQRAAKEDIKEVSPSQENSLENSKEEQVAESPSETESPVQPEIKEPEQTEKIDEVANPEIPLAKVENEVKIEQPENTDLNFHEMENFLPAVKLPPIAAKKSNYEVPAPKPNRHEEEMQRLIAEVEAKMRTKKSVPKQEEPSSENTDVNFSDVQTFEIEPKITEENQTEEENTVPEVESTPVPTSDKPETKIGRFQSNKNEVDETPKNDEWKPMGFSGNTPDSLIGRESLEKKDTPEETEPAKIAPEIVRESDDKPIFNISFFSQKVASLETEKVDHILEEVRNSDKPEAQTQDSNVPTFINTWQNWLKIDRNSTSEQEKISESKEIEKSKVIETFIAKEPKISKLKEESGFVVKEKSDNISHLMTETLAKLYTEQKLYAKAIKAYHTLSEKHPERKATFDEQIARIKELRQNK